MTCNYVSGDEMGNVQAMEECNRLNMYTQKDQRTPLANVDWTSLTNQSLIWIGNREASNDINTEQKPYTRHNIYRKHRWVGILL